MRLYVIEGLDGSGKDTQALLLREYLSGKGHAVVLRVHPSMDNSFGRVSKWSLMRRGRFWRMVATLFYGLDVVRSVVLYCRGDRDVILVRYTLACAYLPGPVIKPVYAVVSFLLPKSPDMFFLDVSPEEALRRIRLRGGDTEMFETLPHLRKNRERALTITGGWKVVDGNKSPEEVFEQIVGFMANTK
jgi:dTMP kinase